MRSSSAVAVLGSMFATFGVCAQTLPIGALAVDGAATPEQVALVLPVTGTLPTTATATVRYKPTSSSTWITGHSLFRVRPEFADSGGPTVEDVFAWPILDLTAATSYDIEVTVTSGVTSVVKTLTTSTRALPPTSGANRTNNNPVYVRGASRNGTVLSVAGGNVIQILAMSNVVFDAGPLSIQRTRCTRSGRWDARRVAKPFLSVIRLSNNGPRRDISTIVRRCARAM
jgi:hypothetical protein